MKGMVVCPEPLAAEAGGWALKKGGNAVDAAIAGAYAQGVVNPKLCGIGGHGRIFVYDKKTGEKIFVNSMSRTGSKAIDGVFKSLENKETEKVLRHYAVENNLNIFGYKAFTVPGFVAGTGEAHERFGRLPWEKVLFPAIKLAKDGFNIYPYLLKMGYVKENLPHFGTNMACRDIYTRNGGPLTVGEVLVQKDYANTLKRIAKEGYETFYRGGLAEVMAEDFEEHGALITIEDLNNYEAWISEPLSTSYDDYEICGDQPPGSGAMKLESFNILELFELDELGWNTPKYLNVVSQALQLAMIDREKYMRDPFFYKEVKTDTEFMISKKHANKQKNNVVTNGSPTKYNKIGSNQYEKGGTTHISSADGEGNVVSFTHSIVAGSGVVTPGLGFMYNCHMQMFDPRPGRRLSIAPNKIPIVSPSPTIIFKDDLPFMAIGSPAGPRGATGEIQAFLNVALFNMTMQQAVSVPRIHCDIYNREIVVESNFPFPYPQVGLKKLGNKIIIDDYTGRLAAIKIDPQCGKLEGGTDPRGGGGLSFIDF